MCTMAIRGTLGFSHKVVSFLNIFGTFISFSFCSWKFQDVLGALEHLRTNFEVAATDLLYVEHGVFISVCPGLDMQCVKHLFGKLLLALVCVNALFVLQKHYGCDS